MTAAERIKQEQKEKTGKLNLSYLKLTEIPKEVAELTWLKELDLSNNQLTKIEGLDSLSQLNLLNLSNNQLTKIGGLETLTTMNTLVLSSNQITKIEGLDTLTLLKTLWLEENKLTKIEGLDSLLQLNKLYLGDNQITQIEGLETLSQLKTLALYSNQITQIEGLETLTQLKMLSLSYNQLTKIEGLETLKQLEILLLFSNQFTKIEALEKFVNLLDHIKTINILNNPFDKEEWINPEILQQVGSDVGQLKSLIQNYLKNKRNIKYKDLPLKIILLGNSQAGKSTTALSLLSEGDNPKEREASTHGLLIRNQKEKNKTKAIMYDFGGQDYYHNTYNMFFPPKVYF